MVFDSNSYQRISKSLGIFWMIGAPFVVVKQLGKPTSFRMGIGHQKDEAIRRYLDLSTPTSHHPGREEGLKIKAMQQSSLCNKDSIKIPTGGGLEDFWVGEHIHVLRRWYTLPPQRQKFLCSWLFWSLP